MAPLASPSRSALAPSAALSAPLRASRRCSLPLAGSPKPKARALDGFKTHGPPTRSSSSSLSWTAFTSVPRASPSDARDALSSSLSADEQAALDAFLSSGGDDAKAKALMVEAATTKVIKLDRHFFFGKKNSTLFDFSDQTLSPLCSSFSGNFRALSRPANFDPSSHAPPLSFLLSQRSKELIDLHRPRGGEWRGKGQPSRDGKGVMGKNREKKNIFRKNGKKLECFTPSRKRALEPPIKKVSQPLLRDRRRAEWTPFSSSSLSISPGR